MEYKSKEDIIIVDLENKESLREALISYKEKIQNNKLSIASGEDYLKCFAKDVDGNIQRLTSSDIINIEFVELALKASNSGDIAFAESRSYEMFSSVLVFVAALEYDDLKEDFLALANQVLKYVREAKYIEDLWLDGWHVFGIDVLVCLVLKYTEYAYLISEYIREDWDSEHAAFIFDALPVIRDHRGYDRYIIKALVSCKNDEAFYALAVKNVEDFENDIYTTDYLLYEHFKANPSDYNFFKSEYIAFAKQEGMEVRDFKSISHAETLIKRICPEKSKQEWKTEIFVEDTFENELAIFASELDLVSSVDFRKPRYDAALCLLASKKENLTYDFSEPEKIVYKMMLKGEAFRLNKERFDTKLHRFLEELIPVQNEWNATTEEKEKNRQDRFHASELICDYLFEGGSFEKIETEIMPIMSDNIYCALDDIIWSFSDEVKHKSLYMLGRFGAMERIDDYWSKWDSRTENGVAYKFFNILIEVGLGVSFAFEFTLRQYIYKAGYNSYAENEFAQLFHLVYAKYDLYNVLNTLPENMIVFALQQISYDTSIKEQIMKFTKHADRKVRDEAEVLLERYK